ncbi:MAG TPA: ATP-grasp domain-containing protein [Methylomirabilota bacterium]|nr:ATP-grasp domain-containing protein [Methylomirabilota bacterium]
MREHGGGAAVADVVRRPAGPSARPGPAAPVLVLDGDQRSALAVTRSLGRRGVPVVVADEQTTTLAGSSRYCRAQVALPSPSRSPAAFVAALAAEVQRRGIGVVLPAGEVTMELVLGNRQALEPAVVPFGSLEAFAALTDKSRLAALAARLGVRAPATCCARGRTELEAALEAARFPLVLKPHRSRVLHAGQWRPATVRYARSRAEALRLWSEDPLLREHPVLVQAHVAGEARGLSCLYDRGRCVAAFAHRRVREKPPQGGVSVLSESVPVGAAMRQAATRVLDAVGWHGVAMVEFKVAPDGTPHLIEVNARFWGSLQLAVDAGVDFPWLLYRVATGAAPEAPVTYRVGVRNRWLLGDLDHLYLTLRGAAAAGAKLRTLLRFLAPPGAPTRHEVLRWDDVGPGWYELGRYLGRGR